MCIGKSIKCNVFSNFSKCHKININMYTEQREKLKRLININEEILKETKEYFKDVISLNQVINKKVDIYEEDLTGNFNNNNCNLNPKICNKYYDDLYNEVNNLKRKYDNVIMVLNKFNEVLNDLKEFAKERKQEYSDICIKFRYDKIYNPVCLYFDRASLNIENSYNNGLTIYLAFGKSMLNQRSKLYFRYIDYEGALKIDEFCSVKRRLWHGSYILEALLENVSFINEEIERYNNEFFNKLEGKYTWEQYKEMISFKNRIGYIFGDMVPGGDLSKEDLKEFYDKNGFIKNNSLYREL